MDRFKWSPTFETGIGEIDDDHRKLFALADVIRDVLASNAATGASLVDEFIEESRAHFRREEAVLARIGFPNRDQHIGYHNSLIAKAEELKRICSAEDDPVRAQSCYEGLIGFLVDDVIRGDSRFKSYVHHHGFSND